MNFKKKIKVFPKIIITGFIGFGIGLTTLVQPAVLGQNHIVKAEDSGLTSTALAGKVTLERLESDTRPDIFAGEEFKIRITWTAAPTEDRLGGIGTILRFDTNTIEYVSVESLFDGIPSVGVNEKKLKEEGYTKIGVIPPHSGPGQRQLPVTFTFRAKKDITFESNYTLVFKADPDVNYPGRIQWQTYPTYAQDTPAISSWDGLNADGTIFTRLVKEQTYKVSYKFISVTEGKTLPAEVTALLPTDKKRYRNNSTVDAKQPAQTKVTVGNETWEFVGYEENQQIANGKDVQFIGKWKVSESSNPPAVKKGSVVVHYVSTDNEKLKEDYLDTKDAAVGTDYNTAENETEKPKSITKDGVTYNLVGTKGNEKGKVVEGLTEVTYVYKKVEKANPSPSDSQPNKLDGKLPNTGKTSENTAIAGLTLASLILILRRRKSK